MAQGNLNSPIFINLPRNFEGVPKNLQGYFNDLVDAVFQLQLSFVDYAGVAPQDIAVWSQINPKESILQQNMNRLYVQATEDIIAGAMVHLYNNSGVLAARNADATNQSRPAFAYCNVSGGVPLGEYGEFIVMQGINLLVSGLTPGTFYFLSTVSGLITTTAPAASGNLVQSIGFALASDILYFNPTIGLYTVIP